MGYAVGCLRWFTRAHAVRLPHVPLPLLVTGSPFLQFSWFYTHSSLPFPALPPYLQLLHTRLLRGLPLPGSCVHAHLRLRSRVYVAVSAVTATLRLPHVRLDYRCIPFLVAHWFVYVCAVAFYHAFCTRLPRPGCCGYRSRFTCGSCGYTALPVLVAAHVYHATRAIYITARLRLQFVRLRLPGYAVATFYRIYLRYRLVAPVLPYSVLNCS